jgi:hypothetical protein
MTLYKILGMLWLVARVLLIAAWIVLGVAVCVGLALVGLGWGIFNGGD